MSRLQISVPNVALREAVGELDDADITVWDMLEESPRERFDVVLPPHWVDPSCLARLERASTRLVQWHSIGFEGVYDHLPSGTALANATGVHEGATAELALALMLAMRRGLPDFARAAGEDQWALRSGFPGLSGDRVLLVGYGGVAKEIEARFAGFEVRVSRVARSERVDVDLAGAPVRVHALSDLRSLLPRHDVVVLALPLTPASRHLVDGRFLADMADGSLLVNVSRGGVVDTDALTRELASGRIRAALDVTDPEPLPAGHPLWALPNALVTPHAGAENRGMIARLGGLVRAQARHLQRGERPENLVIGSWG